MRARELVVLGRDAPAGAATTPSSWPSAFARSFSAVTSASSPGCASWRARSSAAPVLAISARDCVVRRRCSVTSASSALELLDELAHLALALEHAGGDLCRPARRRRGRPRDTHRAVERDEYDAAVPASRERRAAREVAHDDRVADERAHERLVLRREAQRVREATDDGLVVRRGAHELAPAT